MLGYSQASGYEEQLCEDGRNCVPKEENQRWGNLKKLAGKATKRVDADVDGDVDTKDMSSSETVSPCGKKKLKPKSDLNSLTGDLNLVKIGRK